MYIIQRSIYIKILIVFYYIVLRYSQKRQQEDQTKDKYRCYHCLFKFVTSEWKKSFVTRASALLGLVA